MSTYLFTVLAAAEVVRFSTYAEPEFLIKERLKEYKEISEKVISFLPSCVADVGLINFDSLRQRVNGFCPNTEKAENIIAHILSTAITGKMHRDRFQSTDNDN